jgi:hypothetical protein
MRRSAAAGQRSSNQMISMPTMTVMLRAAR